MFLYFVKTFWNSQGFLRITNDPKQSDWPGSEISYNYYTGRTLTLLELRFKTGRIIREC